MGKKILLLVACVLLILGLDGYVAEGMESRDPGSSKGKAEGYKREPTVPIPAGAPVPEGGVPDLLRKATLLNNKNKTDAAILLYYDVLKKDPGNLTALEDLLAIFMKSKNWAMIISTLEKITLLKPDDRILRELLVVVYDYYQMYENAIVPQIDLVRLEPENQEYLVSLAKTMEAYGLLDEVIDLYERLHKLDQKNPRYLSRLGVLYSQKDRFDKGILYYSKLRELSEDKAKLDFTLARLYLQDNRPREALKIYRDALERDPGNARIREEMGYVYADTGRYYFGRKRYAMAENSFLLSSQRDSPYPFAGAYLEEVRAEMSFQPFYDVRSYKYRFNTDVRKQVHTLGTQLPALSVFNKGELVLRRHQLSAPSRDIALHELEANADVDLSDDLRTNLSLGYSDPSRTSAKGRFVFGNTWTWDIDRNRSLDLGILRKRIYDGLESVDKNILETDCFIEYSHSFFETLSTAMEYRRGRFSDGNHNYSLLFDLNWQVFKEDRTPEDPEARPPLHESVRQVLIVGPRLEYSSFKKPSEDYFTADSQAVYLLHGEYSISPLDHFYITSLGSYGKTNKRQRAWSWALSLKYALPFKVEAELGYELSNLSTVKQGNVETPQEPLQEAPKDRTYHFKVLVYF